MFDVIVRTMMRRKKHFFLTIMIVALIFALLLLQSFLYQGFRQGVAISEQRLGADIVVLPKEIPVSGSTVLLTGEPVNVYMDEQQVTAMLAGIDGIEQWTVQFFSQTLNADCCSIGGENRLVGIDWGSDFLVKPWIQGNSIDHFSGNVAIVGYKIPLIDPTIQILNEDFEVVATLLETGTAMDQTIFIPMNKARELTANSDTVLQYWEEDDPYTSISAIFFKSAQGYNPDFLAYLLNQLPDVQVIRAGEVLMETKESFSFIKRLLVLFMGTTIALGMIALVGRYSGYVMDRKKEFGLLMALGSSKKHLRFWILAEACIYSIIGSLFGLLIARISYPLLGRWTTEMQRQPFLAPQFMDWVIQSGIVFIVVIFILMLASMIPGWQISRLWAGQAMNEGELE